MRILIVDDEETLARQVATAIREMIPDAELKVCNNEKDAVELIENKEFDLAVFDLILSEQMTLEQEKDMDNSNLKSFEGGRLTYLLYDKQPNCKTIIASSSKYITKYLLADVPKESKNIIDVLDKNMKPPHGNYSYRDYLMFRIAIFYRELCVYRQ